MFYLEGLSVLGTEFITQYFPVLKFFGLLKMVRIFRLGQMVTNANADKLTKSMLNLLKLTFYLLFYLHVIGCYFWLFLLKNAPE